MADDFSADIYTAGTIKIDESIEGDIQSSNDSDWIKLENLIGGTGYYIDLFGFETGYGTLRHPLISGLYNSEGEWIQLIETDYGSIIEIEIDPSWDQRSYSSDDRLN